MELLIVVARIRGMGASWKVGWLLVAVGFVGGGVPLGLVAQSSGGVGGRVAGGDGRPGAFAVASVRRNLAGTGTCDPEHLYVAADGFRMMNCPLIAALFMAYVPANGSAMGFSTEGRVVGAPEWMRSEKYDIDARVDEADMAAWQRPATQREMLHGLMQSLLAERCRLVVHREMRERPVYALVAGRGGSPKSQNREMGLQEAASVVPEAIVEKHPNVGAIPGGGGMFGMTAGGGMELYGVSMETLAIVLSNRSGRPVVDKTGLTKTYDVKLKMVQPGPSAGENAQDAEVSIFTMVQEQLGLKLESAKGTVETLVIDHVERPAAN